MAAARAARERATIVHDEWNRAVADFNKTPSGDTSNAAVSETCPTDSQNHPRTSAPGSAVR
jgi:N-formylglutamate amidohydrolase